MLFQNLKIKYRVTSELHRLEFLFCKQSSCLNCYCLRTCCIGISFNLMMLFVVFVKNKFILVETLSANIACFTKLMKMNVNEN